MIILILFSIFFFGHLPLSVFVSFLFLFLRSSLEECVDMSAPIVHDVFCDYQYDFLLYLRPSRSPFSFLEDLLIFTFLRLFILGHRFVQGLLLFSILFDFYFSLEILDHLPLPVFVSWGVIHLRFFLILFVSFAHDLFVFFIFLIHVFIYSSKS